MTIPAPFYFNQFGSPDVEESRSIIIDGDRNIYVTGNTFGQMGDEAFGDSDIWVSKYANNGTLIWTQQIGSADFDTARDIDIDAQGNIYIAGWTEGKLGDVDAPGPNPWLAKLANDGTLVWLNQLDNVGRAWDLEVDPQGNAYLSTQGTSSPSLWKYDTNGTLLWNNTGNEPNGLATGAVVDADGNVFVIGSSTLAKYRSDGTALWDIDIPVNGSGHDVAVDRVGNVYVAGRIFGNEAVWLAKYDTSGNLLWLEELDSDGEEFVDGVIVDGNDQVYLSGWTSGTLGDSSAGGQDAFLAQFDANGQLVDIVQWGTPQDDAAVVVQVDDQNNLYVNGWTDGTLGPSSAGDRDAWFGILSDTTIPSLSIGDASVTEGDQGNTAVTLTVTLSEPSLLPVTVNYTTVDGSAIAPMDYISLSGTLTFQPGQVSQSIAVEVVGEHLVELDETFGVVLDAPTNATLSDDQADVEILNDDAMTIAPLLLQGTPNDDHLSGDDGNDRINGRAGDDRLVGKRGDDWLRGGNGDDVLRGNSGDDILLGNSGNDRLLGGPGNDRLLAGRGERDRLNGGGGADTYVLHPKGFAVIRGFEPGTDTVQVQPLDSTNALQFSQRGAHTHAFLNNVHLAKILNTDVAIFTANLDPSAISEGSIS